MAKKSYKELLKESIIGEFDTSKTIDVQGPMLDSILSYKGDGELHTNQDAASILERFYYGEKKDKDIEVYQQEAEQNEISEVPKDNIDKAKKEVEVEVEPTKTVGDSKAVLIKAKAEDIEEDIEIENAVIEKLISELEEAETDLAEQKDEDVDIKPDEEIKDELPADEKDLDIDKELKEDGGALPGYRTSTGKRLGTGGDVRVGDELEEAFQIFKEQVENDDDDDEKKEEDILAKDKLAEQDEKKEDKKEDEKKEEDKKKDEKKEDKKEED